MAFVLFVVPFRTADEPDLWARPSRIYANWRVSPLGLRGGFYVARGLAYACG